MLAPATGWAQQGQARIEAEAVPGKPYGVGVLAIELPRGQRMADPNSGQVSLSEARGRILYPAYEVRPLARLLRGAGAGARRMTVYFLFTGNEPLDLTLATPQPVRYPLTPRPGRQRRAAVGRLVARFSRRPATDVYPRIDDYLTAHAGSPHEFADAASQRQPVARAAAYRASSTCWPAASRCGTSWPGKCCWAIRMRRNRSTRNCPRSSHASIPRPGQCPACAGRDAGGRADRAAGAGRMFLCADRQLREFSVAAASCRRVGRRLAEPDLGAGGRLWVEPADAAATGTAGNQTGRRARADGDQRRGDRRQRHVYARGGRAGRSVRSPQQHAVWARNHRSSAPTC